MSSDRYKVKDKSNKVAMEKIKTKEEAINICMGLTGGGTVYKVGAFGNTTEVFSNK